MTFLSNPWVVGIGTSILSGLIVYLITRKFLTSKENKEYNQCIKTANNEILYAFRPLIVQKNIPTKEIINSIFLSISRKYNVLKDDLYNIYSLIDDLINEIISNAFLSSDQKIEFCNLLNKLKSINESEKEKKQPVVYQIEKKTDSSTYFSLIIAMTTTMMVAVMTFFLYFYKDINSISEKSQLSEPIFIVFIAILIPTLALTMSTMLKYIIRNKEKEKERQKLAEKEKKENNSEANNKSKNS